MEILLIKKFKKTFTVIVIIGVICVCLIIAILAAGVLNSTLNLKVSELEKKLIVYKKALGSNPEQAIDIKKSLKQQLLAENEQINNLFMKTRESNPVTTTPLSFKQFLFSTQDRLKSKALKKKMSLPVWLGFDEYKINVPDADNADVLIKELAIVEEIVNGALASEVSSIESIKLSHQRLSVIVAEQKIKYLPIALSIKSDSGQMKAFLMNISKLQGIFSIKQLKVKCLDENKNQLSADINLKFIEI
ncbi:MAG: Amuc_1100 family pilus-like protein [Candidatus Omnitrophota bacterium]